MTTETRELQLTRASEIRSRRQRWLWSDRIPLGVVTVFAGRGGEGKSTFALYLGARVIRGDLDGDLLGKPSSLLVISHEDDWGAVMVPRLLAAGARTSEVYRVAVRMTVDAFTNEVVPAVPLDLPLIRAAIVATGARLVMIDPLTSTLSGDLHKLADVRSALNPLTALAQELDVAIVAIMHLRKGTGNVSELVSGSHAFRDVSRSVLVFATDDETGERVVTLDKSNYSESRGSSFAFQLVSTTVATDDGEETRVARVEYLGDTDRTAGELFERAAGNDRDDDHNEAERWLIGFMEDRGGVVPAKDVQRAAASDAMSWDGVKRASRRVTSKSKSGFQGVWMWTLDLTKAGGKGAKGVGDEPPAPFAPNAADTAITIL
jgi:hypothetical protein